jgi:hypothetical protein
MILSQPYFPASQLGPYKILPMWSEQVWIVNRGRVDIDPLLKVVREREHIQGVGYIDKKNMAELALEIVKYHGSSVYEIFFY